MTGQDWKAAAWRAVREPNAISFLLEVATVTQRIDRESCGISERMTMQQAKNSIREGSPFQANPLQSGTIQMLMCPKQCYTRARTKRSYTTKNEKIMSTDSNDQGCVFCTTT